MSQLCLQKVWKNSDATHSARLVLLAIAESASNKGIASIPVEALASKVRLTKRQTQNCLRRLQDIGELRIAYNHGSNGANKYFIKGKLL